MAVKPDREGNPQDIVLWLDWLAARGVHRWIHAGYHFKSGSWGVLNGSLNFLFNAGGGSEAHFFHTAFCEGAMQVQVFKDPTIGPGSLGTVLSPFNSNNESENVPQGTLYVNPGIEDVGTRIPYGMIFGGTNVGNTGSGGEGMTRDEEVISPSQQYLISLITEAELDYEYHVNWYEEL